jgi:hypothetical protein
MRRSLAWLQRGWSTFGLAFEWKPHSPGAAASQRVLGCFSTKRMRTIDLADLKPCFQGTTGRIGAGGCIASSSRSPST